MARNTEYTRKQRQLKRENNICTFCSNKRARGRSMCSSHLEYNRKYYRRKLKGK